ncbi:hypothetical protein GYMLUDRAFT_240840 [Collybiopsis luxurians FD-317 M1]|nr:hypothetical protein GYMLUDRAFT_240840 [Collybiopsis luxurians FD-317 M1]
MDDQELYGARMREEAQDTIAEAVKILLRVTDGLGVVERWLPLNQVDLEYLRRFTDGEYADIKFSRVERVICSRKTPFRDQYLVIVESDGHILRSWQPWYLIPYAALAQWWNDNACFWVLGYRGSGADDMTQTSIDDAEEISVGVEHREYAREFWADSADVSPEKIEDFEELDINNCLNIKYTATKVLGKRVHAHRLGTEYLALVGHRGLHYDS